jgi:hypothetical protein
MWTLDLLNLGAPHVAIIPDDAKRCVHYLSALTSDLSLQPVHYVHEEIIDVTARKGVSAQVHANPQRKTF